MTLYLNFVFIYFKSLFSKLLDQAFVIYLPEMLRIVSFVLLVALCASRPSDLEQEEQLGLFSAAESSPVQVRAVPDPTTPNQILDAIIEKALGYIQ